MYKQSTWHFNRYVPKYNYRPDPTFGAIMNVGASGIHIGMKIKQRTYKPTIKPMYQIRSQIHQKPKMEFSGDAKMTKVIGKLGVNKRASGGFKRQYNLQKGYKSVGGGISENSKCRRGCS